MNAQQLSKVTLYLMVTVFILIACAPEATTVPASIITPSTTPPPSKTLTPTFTPTFLPTLTPVPQLPFDIPLTNDNVSKIRQLAVWGNTSASVSAFAADGKTIILQTPLGLSFLSTDDNKQFTFIENAINFAISDDSSLVTVGLIDGTVSLWDPSTGTHLKSFTSQKKDYGTIIPVRSLAFSHDGRNIAAGFADGQVAIWEINSDNDPLVFRGGDTPLYKIAFSPSDKYLYSMSFQLWVHEISGRKATTLWKGDYGAQVPGYWPFTATFSNDETTIALMEISGYGFVAGSVTSWFPLSDCQLLILQMGDGKLTNKTRVEGCRDPYLSFSDDNKYLYSDMPLTKTRQIREASSGFIIRTEHYDNFPQVLSNEINYYLQGYDNPGLGPVANPSSIVHQGLKGASLRSDNSALIWGTTGNTIYWWEEAKGIIKIHKQENERVVFTPDGKIATYCNNREIVVLRLESETERISAPDFPECDGIAISPKGDILIIWAGNRVSLVSPSTGMTQRITGHNYQIASVIFSRDSNLMSITSGTNVIVYQINPLKKISEFMAQGVLVMDFSPNNAIFALHTNTYQDSIKLYKLPEGNRIDELEFGTDFFHIFSPDGKLIAVVEQQLSTVTLWSIESKTKLTELTGHNRIGGGPSAENIVTISFLPTGNGILTIGKDGTVRLWGIDPTYVPPTPTPLPTSIFPTQSSNATTDTYNLDFEHEGSWNLKRRTLPIFYVEYSDEWASHGNRSMKLFYRGNDSCSVYLNPWDHAEISQELNMTGLKTIAFDLMPIGGEWKKYSKQPHALDVYIDNALIKRIDVMPGQMVDQSFPVENITGIHTLKFRLQHLIAGAPCNHETGVFLDNIRLFNFALPTNLLSNFSSSQFITGDNWASDEHGPIEIREPFSITINIEGRGDFSALTLAGRPWTGPEWYKGHHLVFVIIDGTRIRLSFRDGIQENSVIDFTLPSTIRTGLPFTLRFLDVNGKVIQVYDNQNKLVAEYDVTKLTQVSMPDGLFPDSKMYSGYFMSPNAELTINLLSMITETQQ